MMKSFLFLLALLGSSFHGVGQVVVDYYVLAIQWPPAFCNSAGVSCYTETFTIHGLWPMDENGAPLINCQGAPAFSNTQLRENDVKRSLAKHWPSVRPNSLYPFHQIKSAIQAGTRLIPEILCNYDRNQLYEIRFCVTTHGVFCNFTEHSNCHQNIRFPSAETLNHHRELKSIEVEAVTNAEKELSTMLSTIVHKLNSIRQRTTDAVRRYQASENAVARLEMEVAKIQKEIDSLNSRHDYLEKQLDSLEAASQPMKDEIDGLEELKKIISAEEKEIHQLTQRSTQLKEKLEVQLKELNPNLDWISEFQKDLMDPEKLQGDAELAADDHT